jgi:signal transduction histidine kinase
LEKKERDYLDSIKEATVQGQALIKDLLEFSRIGKEEHAQVVDLDKIINGVKMNLKLLIEESGASIDCDGSLPRIKCFPMEMGQLFQNLIENAIKYRSAYPLKMNISAVETKNNMWLLAVRDNGVGISPKDAERIFKIFERVDSGTKTSGTGIGLAICRRVVENYGGKIWVESEVGRGSIFYFTLPR